jgi:hypothetical protein
MLLSGLLSLVSCFDATVGDILDGRVRCETDEDCIAGVCTAGRCLPPDRRVPRIAGPTRIEANEDQPATINLTVDGDIDALVVELVSAPARGAVTLDGLTLTYTPATDAFGADSFELVVSDTTVIVDGLPLLRSPRHRIDVSVAGVADDFVVTVPELVVDEDSSGVIAVDIDDPERGTCGVTVESQPARGRIDAALLFTPAPNASGDDQATLLVSCDRSGVVATKTVVVDISVLPLDDDPVPLDTGPLIVDEDAIIPIALPVLEVDGDEVCFVIVDEPRHGQLDLRELRAGLVVYEPEPDIFGDDSFTFAVGTTVDSRCVTTDARGEVRLTVAGSPDAARFDVDSITVDAVGRDQFIPVPLSSPDGAVAEAPSVELDALAAPSTLGTFRAENGDRGPGLVFTPTANLTATEGLIELRTRHQGLVGPRTILRVQVRGATSCAVARLLDPAMPSGPLLLLPPGHQQPYIAFCEQQRRGGGFELLLKINGQTSTFRANESLWTDGTLLNPTNIAFDGGDAKLAGSTTLPLDDVMIGVQTRGVTPGLFADVTLPEGIAGRTLMELMASGDPVLAPHWGTPAWTGIANASLPVSCRNSVRTLRFTLGIMVTPSVRIGGQVHTLCNGIETGAPSAIGVGLGGVSASGGGGQLVLGRSRDFTVLPEAESCEAQAARYGSAFLPGRYNVAGTTTVCGDLDLTLPRGCGDGSIDATSTEVCDDGDTIDSNLCSNSCQLAQCGDGVVQEPETCDPPDPPCTGFICPITTCTDRCLFLLTFD